MQVKILVPRPEEARITPQLTGEVVISPRFFKKLGWVKLFDITAVDAKNRTQNYSLTVSAGSGMLRLERMTEVIPACDTADDIAEKEDDDTASSGQTGE